MTSYLHTYLVPTYISTYIGKCVLVPRQSPVQPECDYAECDDVTDDADGGGGHREEDELRHELHDENDQQNFDENQK